MIINKRVGRTLCVQARKFGNNDQALTPILFLPFKQGERFFVSLLLSFLPYVSLLFLLDISSNVPAKLL